MWPIPRSSIVRFWGCALAITFLMGSLCTAAASQTTDCPLVHPADNTLSLLSGTIDGGVVGKPHLPTRDERSKGFNGYVTFTAHYASRWLDWDAGLICSYRDIADRRIKIDTRVVELRITMPGLLMRCEWTKRERRLPDVDELRRWWCTHDPYIERPSRQK